MNVEEASTILVRACRHWIKEISNLTKVIDDEEVVALYLKELNRVQQALEVVDPGHDVSMDPDFDIRVERA